MVDPLRVPDGLVLQFTSEDTPTAASLDEDLHKAYYSGVKTVGDVEVVPKMSGYDTFQPGIQKVLRQTITNIVALFFPTWTALSPGSSWANVGGYETAGVRREGGRVWLKGTISGGVSGTSPFTLPTGYWPPAKVRMEGALAVVEVTTAGVVTVTGSGSVGLDGLSFAL